MGTVIVCVPSDMPGGINAAVSVSFEESDVYNYLEISQKGSGNSRISFSSMRYNCFGVACVDPVDAISKKALVLIVSKISPGFLHRFLDEDMEVFAQASGTVSTSAESYVRGELKSLQ